ncbi:helix-turn-helix domain-containing protein [Streptosporangium amethystogenes subsp. fukuiense]|uniref:Helix-turn-helix domain-containing protein n=1 Tax=Streptosporangium amethystogenes subsp. fukuiense TaxID=698418 RepID=A0ABW2SQT0_9ACTN
MNERLWTVDQVADYLGVPKSRVYDRWREWGIPFVRIGQQLRCDPRALQDWISGQKAA